MPAATQLSSSGQNRISIPSFCYIRRPCVQAAGVGSHPEVTTADKSSDSKIGCFRTSLSKSSAIRTTKRRCAKIGLPSVDSETGSACATEAQVAAIGEGATWRELLLISLSRYSAIRVSGAATESSVRALLV